MEPCSLVRFLVPAATLLAALLTPLSAQTRAGQFDVYPVIQSDVSPRLSAVSDHVPLQARVNMIRGLGRLDGLDAPGGGGGKPGGGGGGVDGALQTDAGTSPPAYGEFGTSIDGVGHGFPGFVDRWAPPDTNMAVGPNHFVQWVNTSFAIFNRTSGSSALYNGNAPWVGWSNACATNNDGDPIVQYDRKFDRWIFTQFSVSTKPYLQCLAISTGSDPGGTYFRYAINFGSTFPDYPKMGIWPTGYFFSFNMFQGKFIGPAICALDRSAATSGGLSASVCKQLPSSAGSVLPADQDGPTEPGFPALFVSAGANVLNGWTFVPNFATPSSSTVTQLPSLPIASFTQACGGGACIPQPNTSQQLDSLADRLMYRFAYRKVGAADYFVVTHSVNPGKSGLGVSGIRWYQLQASGAIPILTITQQSTFAPDGNSRWMGSAAMDKCGNIGLGYSISGPALRPGIRFAGSGAANKLQSEIILLDGTGSQTSGLERWGDYSSLRVDPLDDRTFFFTTEYLKSDGTFNWSTRISQVQYSTCLP